MFVFLPPSVEGEEGLERLTQNLNAKALLEAAEDVWFDNIEVALPKMSLASSVDFELKEVSPGALSGLLRRSSASRFVLCETGVRLPKTRSSSCSGQYPH